ncbi:MAG TPA: hypothetical protein VG963_31040 [Polyangiaceae bacterium]|nr:hypothetical protein [Polyangiaceae bacterium]
MRRGSSGAEGRGSSFDPAKRGWFFHISGWLALLGGVVPACKDTPAFEFAPRAAAPCAGACVADPALHCVNSSGCEDSSECPSGTACTSSGSGFKSCQVVDQQLKPTDTLLSGFETDRFRLTTVQSEGATAAAFEWEVPSGAERVNCALFTCLPEIVATTEGKRLVNFDQCVVAWDVFSVRGGDAPSSPFSLAEDVGNQYVPVGDATRCAGLQPSRRDRNVTHLAVGCWSYTSTGLNGATRLLYVKPPQVGAYGDIPKEASCSIEGAQCYEATRDFFGVCREHACRKRCLDDHDCAERAQLIDVGSVSITDAGAGDAGAAPTPPRCVRSADAFLGACMPPEAMGN